MSSRLILFYFLSLKLFGSEMSIYDFIAEEFNNEDKNHQKEQNLHHFTLINKEEEIKHLSQEALIESYQFSYLFCIKIIDYLLKKETSLQLKHQLSFLKEDDNIGSIKDYLSSSINQRAHALISSQPQEEAPKIKAKFIKICILVNRLSHQLLNLVFKFNNDNKPEKLIAINDLWQQYQQLYLKTIAQTDYNNIKKYTKTHQKNHNAFININNCKNDDYKHEKIIELIKNLIKATCRL